MPQVLFTAEQDPLALRVNGQQDSGAITVEDLLAEGIEQTENLLRGDPAWTRRRPPAIALSEAR